MTDLLIGFIFSCIIILILCFFDCLFNLIRRIRNKIKVYLYFKYTVNDAYLKNNQKAINKIRKDLRM